MPPPWGSGRCCNCPADFQGPICPSSVLTSVGPNLSGQSSSPSSVRGSRQPIPVTKLRVASYFMGRHRWVQPSACFSRMWPDRSFSASRCWIIMKAPCLGSLRRVDIVPSHHSMAPSIIASLFASLALFGSSIMMMLPPSPVLDASTEVLSLTPFSLFSNLDFTFWSLDILNLSFHRF